MTDVFGVHKEVRHRLLGAEAVVVHQAAGEVLAVNGLGARILAALDGTASLATIVDALLEEYDVDRDRLEGDVQSFLEQLEAARVVHRILP